MTMPPSPPSFAELTAALSSSSRQLVIIDDDPTGSQSISGLPLVTRWSDDDLVWAFRQDAPGFFVLANTRSHQPTEAARVIREIHANVARTAERLGLDITIASRGDSTLRGHFPLETDVLAAGEAEAGRPVDAVVVIPAYPDAGRITVDSVHYVVHDGVRTPVGETEFARDATFGFQSSFLPQWVEEVTRGDVVAGDVVRITRDDLHRSGATGVATTLLACRDRRVVVVDAADEDDLRIAALGALQAEAAGARLIYRTGPAFLRARCGQENAGALSDAALDTAFTHAPDGYGLVAVGSHVGLTGRQLARLLDDHEIVPVELDITRFLDADSSGASSFDAAVQEAAASAVTSLAGSDVVVMTSRTLVRGTDPAESLRIAAVASRSLVAVVRAIHEEAAPSFVIAKGGITSNDVATDALGIRRAEVVGTLLPGMVSLWTAADGPANSLPYVVFPGNVGDDDALSRVVSRVVAARAGTGRTVRRP